mmetsp:Transcript_56878/g.138470  ORF Transcript_56878/g.138470 Transcript_56878/m.138470 type:complete len:204 (-) Transcript_56878:600-1211(-)
MSVSRITNGLNESSSEQLNVSNGIDDPSVSSLPSSIADLDGTDAADLTVTGAAVSTSISNVLYGNCAKWRNLFVFASPPSFFWNPDSAVNDAMLAFPWSNLGSPPAAPATAAVAAVSSACCFSSSKPTKMGCSHAMTGTAPSAPSDVDTWTFPGGACWRILLLRSTSIAVVVAAVAESPAWLSWPFSMNCPGFAAPGVTTKYL